MRSEGLSLTDGLLGEKQRRALWLGQALDTEANRPGPVDGSEPSGTPALSEPVQADVAIVGGGFTGLWTALELRRREPSAQIVTVLSSPAAEAEEAPHPARVVTAMAATSIKALKNVRSPCTKLNTLGTAFKSGNTTVRFASRSGAIRRSSEAIHGKRNVKEIIIQAAPGLGKLRRWWQMSDRAWTSCQVCDSISCLKKLNAYW